MGEKSINEYIKALVSGAVEITPATFSWELVGGEICEANLLGGTVREAQYPSGLDTHVDLVIALPTVQSRISFELCHTREDERCAGAAITTTEERVSHYFDCDVHRKNIEAVLHLLKIPLGHINVYAEESHMNDDCFGFSWAVHPKI